MFVETAEGTVFRGELVKSTDESVTVRLESGVRTFVIAELEGLEILPAEAVGQEPEAAADGSDSTDSGGAGSAVAPAADPDGAEPGIVPQPRSAGSPAVLGRLPERLGWLGERYLWLVPEGGVQIVSLLLLSLLLLGVCLYLGAGAAGLDGRSPMRSVVFAALVMVVAGIELAAISINPLSIALLVVGNGVLWFFAARSLFGAGLLEGATVFVIGALLVTVGFLVLEVVDFVMITEAVGVA